MTPQPLPPIDPAIQRRAAANWQRLVDEVAAAAERAGRDPRQITIIGVSKYAGLAATAALVRAGCTNLGESRPQQLWEKAAALSDLPIGWHAIGHLQRNKVRRTVPLLSLLHAGDSPRLLRAVSDSAAERNERLDTLVEVNISGDPQKHGIAPDEVARVLEEAASMPGIRIRGLMTMAAREGGPERARRDFAELRNLRDRLGANAPDSITLDELSMGMSGDFGEAIAEGSTFLRIGSRLFEGLEQ